MYDLLGRLVESETGELSSPPSSISGRVRKDVWTLDALGTWGTGQHGDKKGREVWGNLDYHGTPWQLNTAAATEDEGVISDETDQTSRITSRRLGVRLTCP